MYPGLAEVAGGVVAGFAPPTPASVVVTYVREGVVRISTREVVYTLR